MNTPALLSGTDPGTYEKLTSLSETCSLATSCMRPSPIPQLYRAVGFATSARRAAVDILKKLNGSDEP